MFGNRIGWLLSLFIMMCTSGLLFFIYKKGTEPSPPTYVGLNAASYTCKLDIDPRSLATFMSESGDSSEQYKQAIDEYLANPQAFVDFSEKAKKATSPESQVVQQTTDLLVKASKISKGNVFVDRPQELIRYDNERPSLDAAIALGKAMIKLGMLYRAEKNPARAIEQFEGAFALGVRLFEERLVLSELIGGRELFAVSHYLKEQAEATNSSEKADALARFDQQFATFFKNQIDPVRNTLMVVEPNTGDVVALALNGGDPMWRVEATLALGRCRFSGHTRGDQVGATKCLREKLATSSDPRIKLAAEKGLALTAEEFRKLR